MKKLITIISVFTLLFMFVLTSNAEFIIDPDTWTVTSIGETGLSIKLPTTFENQEASSPENAQLILSVGDDDLEFRAYTFDTGENVSEAFDDYCLWETDSMWETEVNGITVIGFISSDDSVYGVMLPDDSGTAVELDFIASQDEERNARALNKASLMLETLSANKEK